MVDVISLMSDFGALGLFAGVLVWAIKKMVGSHEQAISALTRSIERNEERAEQRHQSMVAEIAKLCDRREAS